MAKHVFVTCPHCGHRNAYTPEELDRRATVYRLEKAGRSETYRVTCKECGRPITFSLAEVSDEQR